MFTLDGNGLMTRSYFEIKYHIDDGKSMEEWENLIEETFRGSCRAHRIADVEVGCFLSSGVDSSYVTRLLRDDMPVRAFSIGYAEEKYSELSHATELAEKIGVECITRTIPPRTFLMRCQRYSTTWMSLCPIPPPCPSTTSPRWPANM